MANNQPGSTSSREPTKSMLRRTLFLLAVCGIVAFIVLGARLFKLQVVDHNYYEGLALSQQVRETSSMASRGTIYDTNMMVLAMSSDVETVFISPAEMAKNNEDPTLIAKGLSQILGVDYADILDKTKNTDSWYEVVARKVEPKVSDQVQEFKKSNKLVSIHLEADTKRYYPYGSLACHVIGFVGSDNNGLGGIEYEYNSVLTGTAGRTVRATTAAGTDLMFTQFEDYYSSENGYNAVTTIDAKIQYYMEKHLAQAVQDYDVTNGAGAIAMDVKTGAILGMVSLGNFDLNDYLDVSDEVQKKADETDSTEESKQIIADAQQKQWRNKCLSDTYEPGSTFKIITLATALQEGVVDENSSFYCGGYIEVTGDDAGKGRHCWNKNGHGQQTLTQAVQHSCNVAFIQIGQKIGEKTFYKYCDAFGLMNEPSNPDATPTAITGIDLAGESGSIWWSENTFCNPLNKTQLAAASFGQTFNITPLQLITAVSACVNGGYLMQPYVVRELTDSSGNVVYSRQPTVVRQVISEDTSKEVCKILEKVVSDPVDGTGKNAYVAGYRIGGKTGTSTKTTKEVATGQKEYIVSFIGFAPANDPQIAILAFLDSPKSTSVYISGGQMGAPTVGAMFEDILPYMGIEPQYTDAEKANLDKSVPSVKGMTIAEAEKAVTSAGLKYRVIGSGAEVTDQLPSAHSVIASGTQIILYAGNQPSTATETMIDLTDLTYAVARDRLAAYGLYISTSSSVSDPTTQRVSAQAVAAGTEVKHGTVINVTLTNNSTSMLGRY
jgi:stage V sporulation protein D (sporulation-specific penicillin-binding protein)